MTIPFHPLANLFPLIEGAEFDTLVSDIAMHGQQEEIILLDDQILDGRNRYRACLKAGVEPRFLDFTGDSAPRMFAGKDPLQWVLSKNLHRRHLSESQRAMVGARLANMKQGRPALYKTNSADKPADLPDLSPVKQADAAEMLNVSERSVRTARQVIESGAPELVEAVDKGAVSVSAAADLASLPVEKQKDAIRNADPTALYAVIKEERAKKQAEKKEKRAEREAELGRRQLAAPDRIYGLILADPEWKFKAWSEETGQDRAAANHYPVTETSALLRDRARMIRAIAAPDSAILVWATAPMLKDGIAFLEACGFIYKTHFVWGKDRVSTGYWNRNKHELLLLGTRGDIPCPAMGDQRDSLQLAPVGAHSEKPPFAHEIAEAYFPNLPKIELNARSARPGWDVWGLEAPQLPPAPTRGAPVEFTVGHMKPGYDCRFSVRVNDDDTFALRTDCTFPVSGSSGPFRGAFATFEEALDEGLGEVGRFLARETANPVNADKHRKAAEHGYRWVYETAVKWGRAESEGASFTPSDENTQRGESGTAREASGGQPLPGDPGSRFGTGGDIGGLKQGAQPAPRPSVTEDELLEWKVLSAIASGMGVSGPGVDDLVSQGFVWRDEGRLGLTHEGMARGQFLHEKVKAAENPDILDAVNVQPKSESAPVHDGPISEIPLSDSDAAEAVPHATPGDLNQIIRAGYAQNLPVAVIAEQTGLKPATVKKRASRMGIGDPERQRMAARKAMTALNASRGDA